MACNAIFDKDKMQWHFFYDRTATRLQKCEFYELLDKSKDGALAKFKEQYPNEFADLFRARWNKNYNGEFKKPVLFENGVVNYQGRKLTYAQAYDVLEKAGKLAEFRNECPQGFETLFRAKFNK
ncbi:MAG: hypothetical protein J6S67_08205 [Methanobrevibacter sp.]|nr:hypothetical protein [Methanobrevibacter sp.]